MIWQRYHRYYEGEWRSYLDDDDNDITGWFIIKKKDGGWLPMRGCQPGQAREQWRTALTDFPFKTFKSAEYVCMVEYEKLIA